MFSDTTGSDHLSRDTYEVLLQRAQQRRRTRRAWQLTFTAVFVLVVIGVGVAAAVRGTSGNDRPDAVASPVDTTSSAPRGPIVYENGPSVDIQRSCTPDGETFRVEVNNTSDADVVVSSISLSGVANATLTSEAVSLAPGETRVFEATTPVPEGGTYDLAVVLQQDGLQQVSSGSTDILAACPS